MRNGNFADVDAQQLFARRLEKHDAVINFALSLKKSEREVFCTRIIVYIPTLALFVKRKRWK
jgi:hypothetical protein